ncbi:hypothetical protein FER67_14390 [Salmonella enterica]|nr:hypothetical protein [Salmonella enterica]
MTGRVNKTLVFFTHLFCSKNELSVRSRTVGPQPPQKAEAVKSGRSAAVFEIGRLLVEGAKER